MFHILYFFPKLEFSEVDLQNKKVGTFIKNFDMCCILSPKLYYKAECFTCQHLIICEREF